MYYKSVLLYYITDGNLCLSPKGQGRREEESEPGQCRVMAERKLIIKKKKYQGTTSVLSARLPDSMIQEIDRIAGETGYNRNEIITKCLEFALGNMETEKDEGGRR